MPNKIRPALTLLAVLLALFFLALAVLPYATLKAALSAPMPDADFKSLHEDNAIVFRGLFGLAGLALATGAYALKFLDARAWLADRRAELLSLKGCDEPLIAVLVAASTLLGAFARLPHLWAPLSHDEAYTVTVFAPGLWSTLTNYHAPNNHVFHTLLVHCSIAIFGLAPWAVRLPAFLAGLLMIPAIYMLGKALYDKYTGLLAALIFASLPAAIAYATNARGYSLIGLFTLLSLGLASIVIRQKNLTAWFLLAVCSALGLWTVPTMLFPFGMVFAWLFFEGLLSGSSRAAFLKSWLTAGLGSAGLTFVLYAPIFIFSGLNKFLGVNVPKPWAQVPELAWQHAFGMTREWISGVPAPLAWLLAVGFVLGIVFHRKIASHRIPIQFPGLIWFGVVFLIERPAAWSRIWFFLLAPALIWCCAGIAGLLKDERIPKWKNVSWSAFPLIVLIPLLAVNSVQALIALPEAISTPGREESAILFIKDQLQETDLIIAPSPEDAGLWYYSRVHGVDLSYFDLIRPYERVILFTMPSSGQYVDELIAEYKLENINRDTIKQIQDFGGLKIFLLETN